MKNYSPLTQFTNQYSLSKTIRFELRPVGKTKEHIEAKGLIAQDEQKAENYKKAKRIIDEYHKWFISIALNDLKLADLSTYYFYYKEASKDVAQQKRFDEIKTRLRKQIANSLTKNPLYKTIDKADLFKGKKKENAILQNFILTLDEDI